MPISHFIFAVVCPHSAAVIYGHAHLVRWTDEAEKYGRMNRENRDTITGGELYANDNVKEQHDMGPCIDVIVFVGY